MPDRLYFSDLATKTKRCWLFTMLSVIALACVSCSSSDHQISPPRVQSLRITKARGLPLTDAVPPQANITITPTVPVPTPQHTTAAATLIPTMPVSYAAASSQNTLAGGAKVIGCTNDDGCAGGFRVGYIGWDSSGHTNGTLQFNNIYKNTGGAYTLTIYYIVSGKDTLAMYITMDAGPGIALNVPSTANGDTIGTANITVSLNAGNNTIKFSNPSAPAPDIDKIVV